MLSALTTLFRFRTLYGDTGPVNGPATRVANVSPSDSVALPFACRAIYVGTAGDLTVDAVESGTNQVFKSVPAGTLLPVCATKIYATGTTASNLTIVD